MHSVLIVCTANICRSPMAMGLLRDRVDNSPDWRIESAGTWALPDSPAAENTRLVLQSRGIDIDDHRSRGVTLEMLRDFNLILVMETGHKEALRAEFPSIANRVYLISEMAGHKYSISDPIGKPLDEYKFTAKEFEKIFEVGFECIVELSADPGS